MIKDIFLALRPHLPSADRDILPMEDSSQQWPAHLNSIGQGISQVASSLETDFLTIGSDLMGINADSQKITDQSRIVVEHMSGARIQESIDQLGTILGNLRQDISELEKDSNLHSEMLDGYLQAISKIVHSADELHMLVLNLNMLGFFTRVENAHISSADNGFQSLAQDVKNLAENIAEKAQLIIEKTAKLSSLIQHTLSEILIIAHRRRQQAQSIIDSTQQHQRALQDRHQHAARTAQRIAEHSSAITTNIGDIVASVQYNDITRQQIEHVYEALTRLAEAFEEDERLTQAEKASALTSMCHLQSAQLSRARDELYTAGENIIARLSSIAEDVCTLIDETQEVSWSADSKGISFMAEIDAGINGMIRIIEAGAQEQDRLTSAVRSVTITVGEMATFVQDIERLGLELQLIALNARIKAAHIGTQGVTLDTISGSIYELSQNSREDTKALAAILQEIVASANNMENTLDSQDRESTQALAFRLQEMLSELHRLDADGQGVIRDICDQGNHLEQHVLAVTSGITIHEELKQRLTEYFTHLQELDDQASLAVPQDGNPAHSALLQNLISQYTMESERSIHRQYMQDAQHTDAFPENQENEETPRWDTEESSAAPSTTDADDLGDNIELF